MTTTHSRAGNIEKGSAMVIHGHSTLPLQLGFMSVRHTQKNSSFSAKNAVQRCLGAGCSFTCGCSTRPCWG